MSKENPAKKSPNWSARPEVDSAALDSADGVRVGEEPVPGMRLRYICRGHQGTIDEMLGPAEANREVRVIVQPVDEAMSDEQWRAFVKKTAGSISDPTFGRRPQGEFEQRDALF